MFHEIRVRVFTTADFLFLFFGCFLLIAQTLDSDMQMLVYENYNKFISATETIKRMKTNVEAMDTDMESVK